MTTTTSPIELSKREYIATHLLAATIVEDRIAWAKNFEGNTDKELIRHAIRLTDGLLEQLESL